MSREIKSIAKNKKAYHDYFIDETVEAGIELTGTEVKSLRERGASLRESYASILRGEAWLTGVHIPPYSHGNRANVNPDRSRRLLLHRREIRELASKTAEKGFTIVPVRLYFNESNRVKVELGLARGKKLHDKRHAIAERDHQRDLERALRERTRGE